MSRLRIGLHCLWMLGCASPEAAPKDSSRAVGPPAHAVGRVGASSKPAPMPVPTPSVLAFSGMAETRESARPSGPQGQANHPAAAQEPVRAKVESCRLLAVGDSLTDPKSAGGGYLEAARRHCHCSVVNLGKGGAMVNQMRARLRSHLQETATEYSHIIVFGGVNDLYSDQTAKRSVAKIVADLTTMYQAARARGTKVIAFTVAPWGGFRRYFTELRWQHTLELNHWIRTTKTQGTTDGVIDSERLLSCGVPERLCETMVAPHRDGLHFGPLGHRLLGTALVEAIGPAYCDSSPDAGSDGR